MPWHASNNVTFLSYNYSRTALGCNIGKNDTVMIQWTAFTGLDRRASPGSSCMSESSSRSTPQHPQILHVMPCLTRLFFAVFILFWVHRVTVSSVEICGEFVPGALFRVPTLAIARSRSVSVNKTLPQVSPKGAVFLYHSLRSAQTPCGMCLNLALRHTAVKRVLSSSSLVLFRDTAEWAVLKSALLVVCEVGSLVFLVVHTPVGPLRNWGGTR